MMRTSARVIIDLFDTTAKQDGEYESVNILSNCKLSQLDNEDYHTKNFATMENSGFLLDGSYEFMNENSPSEDFCYWSSSLSDENGMFEDNPSITRIFEKNHSSSGITLLFDPNYPLPVEIKLRLFSMASQHEKTFFPNNYVYFCDIPAENYRMFNIEFIKVKPFSRARLLSINYGQSLIYSQGSERNLAQAKILEEIDITSSKVAVNTSTLKVIDPESLFDITNPKGLYSFLQERQKVKIIELINGRPMEMANHYLKEWSTSNGVISTFRCQDILGLMGGTHFKGKVYERAKAGDIIKEILDDFGFEKYMIVPEIKNELLSGIIPPCSHREALQQVMFACGGVVDTSRSEGIKFYRVSHATQSTVTADRIFQNPEYKITQTDIVSGVDVVAHRYIKEAAESQAYKAVLSSGKYNITFSEPYTEIRAINCTILKQGNFFAQINVPTEREVVILGKKYADNQSLYSVRAKELPSGTESNIKQVKNATLISAGNAHKIAQQLYDFYQYRLVNKLKIICREEKAGNFTAAQSATGVTAFVIERMNIDLTGGFLADVQGLGFALRDKPNSFTGRDLLLGEVEGII